MSDEVEIVFWKSDTKHSGVFKSDFGHSKLMRKPFWATWSPKTNVMSVWKKHFSVFCKFFTDKVVTIIWQIEVKRSKLFNSNFSHRNLLRKQFCNYLELKNECSKLLERAFFSFF